MTDSSAVLVAGPWQHRFVAANGARFHVAEMASGGEGLDGAAGADSPDRADGPADAADAGTTGATGTASGATAPGATPGPAPAGHGPLVVLLHGFPQMWWAWRHQIPALAAAGYRVAAMDLRGSGASDKPPQGYDVPTLARDVAGVIRSLGAHEAVVVGHGLGGAVAWSMPGLQPDVTRAVASFGTPHPSRMHTGEVARALALRTTARRLGFFQLPFWPEHRLTHGDLALRVLAEWGAPGWLRADVAQTYRMAMQVPFAAHSAMESVRWLVRSTPRVDGQRYLAAVRAPIEVPVLQVHGSADRCIPASVARCRDGRGVAPGATPPADYRFELVTGAGHFLPEEAPDKVSAILVDWLDQLDASRQPRATARSVP